jgi:hypothetical protein
LYFRAKKAVGAQVLFLQSEILKLIKIFNHQSKYFLLSVSSHKGQGWYLKGT